MHRHSCWTKVGRPRCVLQNVESTLQGLLSECCFRVFWLYELSESLNQCFQALWLCAQVVRSQFERASLPQLESFIRRHRSRCRVSELGRHISRYAGESGTQIHNYTIIYLVHQVSLPYNLQLEDAKVIVRGNTITKTIRRRVRARNHENVPHEKNPRLNWRSAFSSGPKRPLHILTAFYCEIPCTLLVSFACRLSTNCFHETSRR